MLVGELALAIPPGPVAQSPIDHPKAKLFGGTWDGSSDITEFAQAALNSGGKVIDFFGLPGRITSSLNIPRGVEVVNANFIAGVPGMKMLLVESNSKVSGSLTGTGTGTGGNRGVNEWGVYPSQAGVDDVRLDLDIKKVSIGVQIWNRGSGAVPQRWGGKLRFSDITGGGKMSNGYGLLVSGADNCVFDVFSKNTPRHCVYLSNGSRGNQITLQSIGAGGPPVIFGAYNNQDYVENNIVIANVSEMNPTSSATPYAVGLVGKVRGNKVMVQVSNSSAALGAVLFRALNSNTVPYDNEAIVYWHGGYSGGGVVQSDSAFGNTIEVFGEGGSSVEGGGAIVSVNDYNGIPKPQGNYEYALFIRRFFWTSHALGARGVAAYVSYAPVGITEEAEQGIKYFGLKMFSTSGGGQVVVVKRPSI